MYKYDNCDEEFSAQLKWHSADLRWVGALMTARETEQSVINPSSCLVPTTALLGKSLTCRTRGREHVVIRQKPRWIMNTDQGSQFTSFAWTDRLRRSGVRISMDGKGRFLDNIFVERLWRSLKYECV